MNRGVIVKSGDGWMRNEVESDEVWVWRLLARYYSFLSCHAFCLLLRSRLRSRLRSPLTWLFDFWCPEDDCRVQACIAYRYHTVTVPVPVPYVPPIRLGTNSWLQLLGKHTVLFTPFTVDNLRWMFHVSTNETNIAQFRKPSTSWREGGGRTGSLCVWLVW